MINHTTDADPAGPRVVETDEGLFWQIGGRQVPVIAPLVNARLQV